MENDGIKQVKLNTLRAEDGAEELVESPAMAPYVRLAEALLKGGSLKEEVRAIAALPLEERYLWRVLSALKWGFADFDSANVTIDRKTLRPEDRSRVAGLIQHRPVQFCLFLKALLGEEAMEQMMVQAIAVAKRVPRTR
jgi:hypothetical protein